jgi:hypothetical protein
METKRSPYLLIFRDSSPATYQAMSAEQRQQLMQQWNVWYDGLAAQDKVQHGHPLEPQGRVVSGARGERIVEGPFAEATEGIGGIRISDSKFHPDRNYRRGSRACWPRFICFSMYPQTGRASCGITISCSRSRLRPWWH